MDQDITLNDIGNHNRKMELITYSLPHQHPNVSISHNLLCQFYLRSFIQLNKIAIYNLIIKCDLNSNIVSNKLYTYNISEQFNGKQSSEIKDINTTERNINNGTLEDFLVVKSNDNPDKRFISIHHLNKINILLIHTIQNEEGNVSVKHENLKCKDESDKLFSFSNCKFRIDMISNDEMFLWVVEGNTTLKRIIFLVELITNIIAIHHNFIKLHIIHIPC